MRNVYLGDSGVLVQYMQLALNRAGIQVAIDGRFGRQTCAGLRTFLGEDVGCYVDKTVWNRLKPYLKGYMTYTINRGDTLWRIARRYRTCPKRIARINGIRNANLIYPGQVLKIY